MFTCTHVDTVSLTLKQTIILMILENDWLLGSPTVCQKKKLSSAMSKFALVQLCC